jgi:hypothetical protein
MKNNFIFKKKEKKRKENLKGLFGWSEGMTMGMRMIIVGNESSGNHYICVVWLKLGNENHYQKHCLVGVGYGFKNLV